MKIRPIPNRITVKAYAPEEETTSDVSLPDTDKQKLVKGEVIAVGKTKIEEDGTHMRAEIKEGDIISFSSDSATEVKVGNEVFLLISIDDVLEVILD